MKEKILMEMNKAALSLKDLIKYSGDYPNSANDNYYLLGALHTYEEIYQNFVEEKIPDATLKNLASACMAVYIWERDRRANTIEARK